MNTLAWVMGLLSGLRFVAPDLPAAVMVVTALAMQITLAVICRIFAVQSGRDGRTWTIAGLCGGVLATSALLIANEVQAARAEPRD